MMIKGSVSYLIHMTINLFCITRDAFRNRSLRNFFSLEVVLIVIYIGTFAAISTTASQKFSPLGFFPKNTHCVPFASEEKDRKIILRVDDVQAFAWSDVSKQLISDTASRNIPLVMGIIPNGISDDVDLVDFINKHSCNIEIAQHGFDHGLSNGFKEAEFSNISTFDARKRISMGRKILQATFDQTPITFIPPNNSFNQNTYRSLKAQGFKIVSSEGTWFFDFDASTFDSETNQLVREEEIVKYCNDSFDKKGACVVMLHPQDYATDGVLDQEKYAHFLSLLDQLETQDAQFVKMQDLLERS